jgi:phosphate transport system permease protein
MAEPTQIRRIDQRPLQEAISTRGRSVIPGLTKDDLIKYFFFGSACISILVLFLIMLSLFSQSVGFNPAQGFFGQNYRNLLVYRQAGLEFVDIIKKETDALDGLSQVLADARLQEFKRLLDQGKAQGKSEDQSLADANAALGPFDEYAGKFSGLDSGLADIISNLSDTAMTTASSIKIVEDKKAEKQLYLNSGKQDLADKVTYQEVDLAAAVKPMTDAIPSIQEADKTLVAGLMEVAGTPPPALDEAMKTSLAGFNDRVRALVKAVPGYEKRLAEWSPNTPLPWYAGIVDFFTNTKWLTASSWQNYYGILPLLIGSTLISVVALVIAVPLGVGAGIYINQIATPWEQNIVKPAIEFISAIPSVVLGFFGVAVLGQGLIGYSQQGLLYFIPTSVADSLPSALHDLLGFSLLPHFEQRLNIMTAGILLAFMAIPTIFTLTEDAINNVPRSFKEASYALGANRLQTIWRIILPASLSGVISAVLLGFGRVIGETMVVLLCAGNRIAIPPMSAGLMIVFQPVHTMTGIIAQELGEAENGSIEWRALFMVGLLLFLISLGINFMAQRVVQKYKISIG